MSCTGHPFYDSDNIIRAFAQLGLAVKRVWGAWLDGFLRLSAVCGVGLSPVLSVGS